MILILDIVIPILDPAPFAVILAAEEEEEKRDTKHFDQEEPDTGS